MKCLSPIQLSHNDDYSFLVPCGSCDVCKEHKIKEWSLRMYHEMDEHEKYSFITLTYDDEHLPLDESLDVREMQLFWKRLRKNSKRKFKYYYCGEYGTKNRRPHYHAILYGFDSSDEDKELINDSWSKGFVDIGTVTQESIKYCLNYTKKQIDNDLKSEYYKSKTPPFQRMSKGIGKNYVSKNKEQLMQNLHITKNGYKYSIPRYYLKKMDLTEKELLELGAKRLMEIEKYSEKLSKEDPNKISYDEYLDREIKKVAQRKLVLQVRKKLKERS